MNYLDDHLLLTEIKAGSIVAYEKLFKKYYKPLTAQAFYFLNDEMEAEDLVQNLFIYLWQQESFAKINSSLKSYLNRAVQNKCLTILEKRKVERRRLLQYLETHLKFSEEKEVEKKEQETKLDRLLNFLPEQRMEAFSLVYLEDKKYKEAAEKMGISVNSIKTHLRLAVRALRKRWTED